MVKKSVSGIAPSLANMYLLTVKVCAQANRDYVVDSSIQRLCNGASIFSNRLVKILFHGLKDKKPSTENLTMHCVGNTIAIYNRRKKNG